MSFIISKTKYLTSFSISVRNILGLFALFSLLAGLVIMVTSIQLIIAIRKVTTYFWNNNKTWKTIINIFLFSYFKEYETKMRPWLWSFGVFTVLRFLASLFFAIVNDLIFAYNIFMVLLWLILLCTCVYSWLCVYSFFLELKDLSKLEDLAHLRVSLKCVKFKSSWKSV